MTQNWLTTVSIQKMVAVFAYHYTLRQLMMILVVPEARLTASDFGAHSIEKMICISLPARIHAVSSTSKLDLPHIEQFFSRLWVLSCKLFIPLHVKHCFRFGTIRSEINILFSEALLHLAVVLRRTVITSGVEDSIKTPPRHCVANQPARWPHYLTTSLTFYCCKWVKVLFILQHPYSLNSRVHACVVPT